MSLLSGNGGLSAADIAAVMGNGNGNYGFSGDGAWWLVIIMLFALTGGWGNNGNNGNVGKTLLNLLEESNMHLRTGFVGTPFLCQSLSDAGYSQSAYTLLFQDDFPSWLYEVKMGATTIW